MKNVWCFQCVEFNLIEFSKNERCVLRIANSLVATGLDPVSADHSITGRL